MRTVSVRCFILIFDFLIFRIFYFEGQDQTAKMCIRGAGGKPCRRIAMPVQGLCSILLRLFFLRLSFSSCLLSFVLSSPGSTVVMLSSFILQVRLSRASTSYFPFRPYLLSGYAMPRIDAKSGGSGNVLASWLPGVRALTQRLLRRATPHTTVSGKFPFCPNALFWDVRFPSSCMDTSLWLVYQWYTFFFPPFFLDPYYVS